MWPMHGHHDYVRIIVEHYIIDSIVRVENDRLIKYIQYTHAHTFHLEWIYPSCLCTFRGFASNEM